MTRAVELNGLTKAFGDVVAVDDVSAVESLGQVTALLGPNGAGKTTTLRTLLKLVAPTAGTATFDGLRYDELPEPVRQVGALLEASGWHPGHTALAHLHILATAAWLPCEAPERALDEPTNGLDPPGVRWLRGYLRRLADERRTVLLSSHALSEVELTADHVLVLSHGRLARSASLDVLRTEAGVGSRTRTPEPDRLCAVLDAADHAYRHTEEELVVDAAPEQVGELAAVHGIVLHALAGTGGLEQAFFHLIEQSDTAAQPSEVRS